MSPSPLTVGLVDLLRRPGSVRELQVQAQIDDLVLDELEVRAGPEVAVHLRLEALTDGLVVSGTATTDWHGICRRCLEPVHAEVHAEVREVFSTEVAVPGAVGQADAQPLTATDLLDLTQTVREAVLLALPLAPLCRDDCPGPAPDRFPTTSPELGDEEDEEAPRDPRWAALDALRDNLE